MNSTETEGIIFNVQPFSLHDGPGIRTTVFFKGCNLRCFWCHNPESQRACPEIEFFPRKCVGCGACIAVCPAGAQAARDGRRVFLRENCIRCGKCAEACYAEALVPAGRKASVEALADELEKDRAYYERSGGGVTVSGGEPLLQLDFLRALLAELKGRGIHTAVDTAGCVPWEAFEAVLPHADLFLYDVKTTDDAKHRRATGAGNALILDNLRRLSASGAETLVRVPVIPGFNDGAEDIEAIAALIRSLPGRQPGVELLPYHSLGQSKYAVLGMACAAEGLQPPSGEALDALRGIFTRYGITCKGVPA